jgi:hypothetical protein
VGNWILLEISESLEFHAERSFHKNDMDSNGFALTKSSAQIEGFRAKKELERIAARKVPSWYALDHCGNPSRIVASRLLDRSTDLPVCSAVIGAQTSGYQLRDFVSTLESLSPFSHTANAATIMPRIKRMPMITYVGFEPGAKIHGIRCRRDADVAKIARGIAGWDMWMRSKKVL